MTIQKKIKKATELRLEYRGEKVNFVEAVEKTFSEVKPKELAAGMKRIHAAMVKLQKEKDGLESLGILDWQEGKKDGEYVTMIIAKRALKDQGDRMRMYIGNDKEKIVEARAYQERYNQHVEVVRKLEDLKRKAGTINYQFDMALRVVRNLPEWVK